MSTTDPPSISVPSLTPMSSLPAQLQAAAPVLLSTPASSFPPRANRPRIRIVTDFSTPRPVPTHRPVCATAPLFATYPAFIPYEPAVPNLNTYTHAHSHTHSHSHSHTTSSTHAYTNYHTASTRQHHPDISADFTANLSTRPLQFPPVRGFHRRRLSDKVKALVTGLIPYHRGKTQLVVTFDDDEPVMEDENQARRAVRPSRPPVRPHRSPGAGSFLATSRPALTLDLSKTVGSSSSSTVSTAYGKYVKYDTSAGDDYESVRLSGSSKVTSGKDSLAPPDTLLSHFSDPTPDGSDAEGEGEGEVEDEAEAEELPGIAVTTLDRGSAAFGTRSERYLGKEGRRRDSGVDSGGEGASSLRRVHSAPMLLFA